MSTGPATGRVTLLPAVAGGSRIELHRPLQAHPDAVLAAIQAELSRIGCGSRPIAPGTLEIDGSGVQGFVGRAVRGGTVTLDLSDPRRAALRLNVRLGAWETYGWAAVLAVAVAIVPALWPRVVGWLVLLALAVNGRNEAMDALDDAIREGAAVAARAARQPARQP
ncbi:MAG TPA: hypothetical protein VFJ82_23380 [Longimicrobium sp.]|nr:hypothetical protein [Longimicrobium sp.]